MTKKTVLRLLLGIVSLIIPIAVVGISVSRFYQYSLLKWVGLLICALGFYLSGLINQKTPLKFIPFLYFGLLAFIPLRYFHFPLNILFIVFATISLFITRKEFKRSYKAIPLIAMILTFTYFLFSQPLTLRSGNTIEKDIYGDVINGKTLWNFTQEKAKILPSESFRDINNKEINLESYQNKTLYISFWATWCAICLKEKPRLDSLKEQFKDNPDVVFIDISLDKDVERWKNYVMKNEPTGAQLISSNESATKNSFDISVIPKHLVVNSKREYRAISGMELPKIILADSTMVNNYINKKLKLKEASIEKE
ncbi:MAG: TlpA family protein disulfide reductase [Gelidibacter sp.]